MKDCTQLNDADAKSISLLDERRHQPCIILCHIISYHIISISSPLLSLRYLFPLFSLTFSPLGEIVREMVMSMVVVDASCLKQADSQPKSCGSEGRRPLGAALHSPDEPSELSQ